MPVIAKCYVTIRCDGCGEGHDEIGVTPKYAMDDMKAAGWTGNYRKCFCPECSKKRAAMQTHRRALVRKEGEHD